MVSVVAPVKGGLLHFLTFLTFLRTPPFGRGSGKAVILVRRIEPVALCGYALPQPSPWRRPGPTRPQRACQQGLTSIQYRLGFI